MESTVAASSRLSEAELALQAERSVSPEETRESESELAGCRVRGRVMQSQRGLSAVRER